MRYLLMYFLFLINNGYSDSIAAHSTSFATNPVLVQVVTSLSCSGCAAKAQDIKNLLDDYVKQGRIRVDWVDYAADFATLTAAKLTWSAGPEKRYTLYRHILSQHEIWHTKEWRTKLKEIAKNLGLNDSQIDKAFEDDTEDEQHIVSRIKKIEKKIQFVPCFILNQTLMVDIDRASLEKGLQDIAHKSTQDPLPTPS